jgi:hypothetical protein
MKRNISAAKGHSMILRGKAAAATTKRSGVKRACLSHPRRVALFVHHYDDHADVTTVNSDGSSQLASFESSGQALAAIQCPQNHGVAAWIDGQPTVLNCWVNKAIV